MYNFQLVIIIALNTLEEREIIFGRSYSLVSGRGASVTRSHIRDRVEERVQNDGCEERQVTGHRVVDYEEYVVLVELVIKAAAHEHLLNVALHL